jgi:hypothetical protein
MAFEDVVETGKQFPPEQQEMLIDLLRGWRIQARRMEIAEDARESVAASHNGRCAQGHPYIRWLVGNGTSVWLPLSQCGF